MKTFCVQTLGCKVNHYESEQVASLLRSRGLTQTDLSRADLRVVNTCSVTVEAASKSRQTARRLVRLPLLSPQADPPIHGSAGTTAGHGACLHSASNNHLKPIPSVNAGGPVSSGRPRVVVMGCWATSDPSAAGALPGVDAVLTHHGDVAAELDRLLVAWRNVDFQDYCVRDDRPGEPQRGQTSADKPITLPVASPPEPFGNEGWMIEAGSPAGTATDARTQSSKADSIQNVNAEVPQRYARRGAASGTTRLPLLGDHQSGRQRAVLKVQDGCDAHCTYCIIPTLRPIPWSKPVDDVVEEARRLVDAGHVEVVLTGIFLGAYGQPTALRRRQPRGGAPPIGQLVEALCTWVPGLRRLRLSSLEPGDLSDDLLRVLRGHPQVVPHFHLPLQSGSDALLRRMNRQYGRDDFLRMVDRVRESFDRPALTTDIIVGFPGETDDEFARTLEVVDHAAFIHVHAFPFSPRPGTAAARWGDSFVRGPVVNERIETLRRRAADHSFAFRRKFLGEAVELLVEEGEHAGADAEEVGATSTTSGATRHGRCERYFDVHFDARDARPGDFVRVRVDEVSPRRTYGRCVAPGGSSRGPR